MENEAHLRKQTEPWCGKKNRWNPFQDVESAVYKNAHILPSGLQHGSKRFGCRICRGQGQDQPDYPIRHLHDCLIESAESQTAIWSHKKTIHPDCQLANHQQGPNQKWLHRLDKFQKGIWIGVRGKEGQERLARPRACGSLSYINVQGWSKWMRC